MCLKLFQNGSKIHHVKYLLTYWVEFSKRILDNRNIDVLHANLLSIVCGGGSRQGQQQHVDYANVFLTSPGAHAWLVMIPHLDSHFTSGLRHVVLFFNVFFQRSDIPKNKKEQATHHPVWPFSLGHI